MKSYRIRKTISILFTLYILILLYILFFYGGRAGNQFGLKVFSKEHLEMVNLVPFSTIRTFYESFNNNLINNDIVIRNIASNLLMFVPMGMALPVLFNEYFNKWWKLALFTVLIVFTIEIFQFITFLGYMDIDDLILNTVGSLIGYAIVHLKIFKKMLSI